MKVTQDEVVDNQAVLNIELEEDDLDAYLERGYRRVVNRLKIPGFRQGKAPRRIVEGLVGREGLLSEALDFMLPDATDRAVADRNLVVVGAASYDLSGLEPVSFTATVPLKPEVDLGDYKDIRVASELKEVTAGDVEAELIKIRESMAIWEPVERESALEDMVTVNIRASVEDRTILDQQGANVALSPGNEDSGFPGLFEHLTGLKEDESAEFELTLGERFQAQGMSGSTARFEATVTGVKRKVIPDLDDDFASGVGQGYDSLQALRDDVESNLELMANDAEDRRLRAEAMRVLVEGAHVPLPPMLAEHRLDRMKAEREQTLTRMGMTLENYLAIQGATAEEMDERMMEQASLELRSAFVLEKFAEEEEIAVSESEIDERLETMTASAGRKVTNKERRALNSAENRQNLGNGIRNEKAVDRLLELITVEPPEQEEREGTEHQTND